MVVGASINRWEINVGWMIPATNIARIEKVAMAMMGLPGCLVASVRARRIPRVKGNLAAGVIRMSGQSLPAASL